jgi:serine/threonine protein kinase/formylglycine-generating enzyme required for sulfatase activity/energy-coupling factor transporter ATP-binding protein EcfA2
MVNPPDSQGEPTKPTIEGAQKPQEPVETPPPEFLGRYRIEKVIGKGGYGIIYRAWDEQLKRSVAIKVLNSESLSPELHQRFLEEARIVASLDHPNIVPAYDFGQSKSGPYYIVSRFIDGSDLNKRMQQYPVTRRHAMQIVAEIADALHYAHSKGLVHRDVKPANILIDSRGRSYLTDFGIALREQSIGAGSHFIGTPEYMSPEQIRGESHRVDHRSDIFSLGLVFYRLLTGRGPFIVDSDQQLMDLITSEDVRTPRVFDESISVEVERICMKALARRPNDRYSVAIDFADDLRWILGSGDPGSEELGAKTPKGTAIQPAKPTSNLGSPKTRAIRPKESVETTTAEVIPKGLRSYDENDAEFFLQLLPGPYDRKGMPESVRSWIQRISNRGKNSQMAMAIYGPSGCGKSSLIKAGVIPKLSEDCLCVVLDAVPGETETVLTRELRTLFPLATGDTLTEILASVRRKQLIPNNGKLLIVIDQFEQWLSDCNDYPRAELTEAIRQCDGVNIQAIFLIRDDFWVPLNRFFKELEIQLVDGQNCDLVDLFDKGHATKVLGLFGIAFGKLPASESQWTEQQRLFLERSIESLSEAGKIVPVKLSLYADTIKTRDWNLSSFKEIGGIEGVGLSFLHESFDSKYAKPENRQHAQAAQDFLSQLLPPRGSEIKGLFKLASELQRACGYEGKPEEFAALVQILDRKLRLITSVGDTTQNGTNTSQTAYQLTHDYLVPSLREWLTRNKRSSPQGRAELVLDECSRIWVDRKEEKQLPTFWETVAIYARTHKSSWNQAQSQMMRAALWHHGERMVFLTVYLTLFSVIGLTVRQAWFEQNRLNRIQERIRQVMSVDPAKLSSLIDDPTWTTSVINDHLAPIYSASADSRRSQVEQLHAKIIAVKDDKSLVLPLREELLSTDDVEYLQPLMKALARYSEDLDGDLIKLLNDPSATPKRRFYAALFLLESSEMRIANDWSDSHFELIATQLLQANSEHQPILRNILRPMATKLMPSIERAFQNRNLDLRIQESAANAFKDWVRDDPVRLADLVASSNPKQFEILFPLIRNDPSRLVLGHLSSIVSNMSELIDADIYSKIQLGKRRATAAISLVLLGDYNKTSPLFLSTDNPEAITQFIHLARKEGVTGADLMNCMSAANAFNGNSIALYAFLSLLGDYDLAEIPSSEREYLIQRVGELYLKHPESKIHSIAYWLLKKWDKQKVIQEFELQTIPYSPDREWFQISVELPLPPELASETVKSKRFCYTFVVFQPGKYELGCREIDDPDRQKDEDLYQSYVSRPFAILDREVTLDEIMCLSYQPFASELTKFGVTPDSAAFYATWYDSVAYCRWLSKQIGIDENLQAYPDHESLDSAEYPRDQQTSWAPLNWPIDISKPAFRLPMESEWEIAARGNSKSRFSFGAEMELLHHYAWFDQNSNRRVHMPRELRPNLRGLFDVHGNVFEWCHGWSYEQRPAIEEDPTGPAIGSTRVDRGGGWYYGGTQCRPTFKYGDDPSLRGHNLGFRIALTLDPVWIQITNRQRESVKPSP